MRLSRDKDQVSPSFGSNQSDYEEARTSARIDWFQDEANFSDCLVLTGEGTSLVEQMLYLFTLQIGSALCLRYRWVLTLLKWQPFRIERSSRKNLVYRPKNYPRIWIFSQCQTCLLGPQHPACRESWGRTMTIECVGFPPAVSSFPLSSQQSLHD